MGTKLKVFLLILTTLALVLIIFFLVIDKIYKVCNIRSGLGTSREQTCVCDGKIVYETPLDTLLRIVLRIQSDGPSYDYCIGNVREVKIIPIEENPRYKKINKEWLE